MLDMFHGIAEFLKTNPWMIGGFTMLIGGGAMAWMRNVPKDIIAGIKRQCVVSVDITDSNVLFNTFKTWLNEQTYSKKSRLVSASWDYHKDELTEKYRFGLLLTPAPGNHVMWYKKRLLWIVRSRKEASGGSFFEDGKYIEQFYIYMLGRSQACVRELFEDVRKLHEQQSNDTFDVYVNEKENWHHVAKRKKRSFASIILDQAKISALTSDVEEFLKSKEWYQNIGIPYHRGYMMYGIPGSGKSSIVSALASKYDMPVYNFNFSSMSDNALIHLMLKIPSHSIILMEDIDASFKTREDAVDIETNDGTKKSKKDKEEKTGVTLSGLLNVLDGLFTKDGTLVFMTTNHLEKLDPALIRPGRIDFKMHFDYASKEQLERMFTRFFPGEVVYAKEFASDVYSRVSMAELQNYFLKHKDQLDEVVANVNDLNKMPRLHLAESNVA